MNISEIITRIKLQLGLFTIATPFENLDEIITKIITDITIPVFSLYCPAKETMRISLNELEQLDKASNFTEYLLPDFKTRKLLNVIHVEYASYSLGNLGLYADTMPTMYGSLPYQMMLSNAGASVADKMIPKITHEYIHPRRLRLYNAYISNDVVMNLAFEHDKSLASIPETARESFLDLALLDVKANLYPTMKQYTEINTAIGNINLKMDDWANADDSRNSLLEKWNDTYHLDTAPIIQYC